MSTLETIPLEEVGSVSGSRAIESEGSDDSSRLPFGWEKFVHLNGGIYYTYDDGRLLTTDDIHVKPTLGEVLKVYTSAEACFHRAKRCDPAHPETAIPDLEMSVMHVDGVLQIRFASWKRGESYDYIGNEFVRKNRSSFWEHVARFPMHRRKFRVFMETEFLGALAFGANERILEIKATTFPFEDAQIERLIRIYRDLRGPADCLPGHLIPALCHHVARVMIIIEASRERYKYGTREARIYRDVAIPPPTWKVRIWDFVLGIILCGTHKNYRVRLEATIPKGVVALREFRLLMKTLLSEWADSNLVATVLVSVTVGFLAVPITPLQRSAAMVSSLCAMTSIVTGLHHVWQHREKTEIESADASKYLRFFQFGPRTGPNALETPDFTLTACLLALPLATLQWSVLSFTLAISAFAFQSTTAKEGRILLSVLIGVLGIAAGAVFLFFWRIWAPRLYKEMEEGFNPNLAQEPELPWFARWINKIQGRKWGEGDGFLVAASNGESPLVAVPDPQPLPPVVPTSMPVPVPADSNADSPLMVVPSPHPLPPSAPIAMPLPIPAANNSESPRVNPRHFPPAMPISMSVPMPSASSDESSMAGVPNPQPLPPVMQTSMPVTISSTSNVESSLPSPRPQRLSPAVPISMLVTLPAEPATEEIFASSPTISPFGPRPVSSDPGVPTSSPVVLVAANGGFSVASPNTQLLPPAISASIPRRRSPTPPTDPTIVSPGAATTAAVVLPRGSVNRAGGSTHRPAVASRSRHLPDVSNDRPGLSGGAPSRKRGRSRSPDPADLD